MSAPALSACAPHQQEEPERPQTPLAAAGEPREIALGEEESGRLVGDDATAPITGARFHVYRVSLSRGDILYATAESAAFTPALSLFGPDETHLASSLPGDVDDAPPATPSVPFGPGVQRQDASPDPSPRVIADADRDGEHLLVVSSAAADAQGSYRVRASLADNERTAFELLSPVTDFVYPGAALDSITGNPGARHRFEIDESAVLRAELTDTDFQGHIAIIEAERDAVVAKSEDDARQEPRVVASLEPGAYEIAVSSTATGDYGRYVLDTRKEEADLPGDFALGEDFEGLFGAAREEIPGLHREGEPMPFEIGDDRTVRARLSTTEPQPVQLVLTDPRARPIAESQPSMPQQDAELFIPLEAGEYILWVSSHGPLEGRYVVETEIEDYPDIPDQLIPGDEIWSVLTHAAETYRHRDDRFVEYFELEIEEETSVRIDMMSTSLDAYLFLEDDDGQIIGENDDVEPGNTDARIEAHLEPGTYRIAATTFARHETGHYTLSVEGAPTVPVGSPP